MILLSDVVYLVNPEGYVGFGSAESIKKANRLGKLVYASEKPLSNRCDFQIKDFVLPEMI